MTSPLSKVKTNELPSLDKNLIWDLATETFTTERVVSVMSFELFATVAT
jgi:hypothetical protein